MKRLRYTLLCAAFFLSQHAMAGVTIQHWTTANGADVLFVASDVLPMLDVQVNLGAGSAQDPAAKSGLASLTRSLLEAGAGDMDEEAIAERVSDLGIQLSGKTDSDQSSITLRTLSDPEQRNGGLALLKTLLGAPTFPEAAVAREKARSIAAIKEAETRPATVLGKRFAAMTYPNHPYGQTSTVESVGAITREDIEAFHKRSYSSRGAIISMIGAISRSEAERIAEDLATALPGREPLPAIPAVPMPAADIVRISHPSAQTHIAIGAPALKCGDPDFYALLVGNYTLGGGGFVSRLMQEVREKRGFAYDVRSYFSSRKLEGPFQIGLQTRNEQADAALKVVNDVVDAFLASGPSEAELKAAKRFYVDSLAMRTDSNAELLGYLATIGFCKLPLTYLDEFPQKVNAVTTAQVRDAFARHVNKKNLVTVIVGGSGGQ